jgi:hypothetical protein
MNEERRKVLDMLASGKITVDEAEKLLSALFEGAEGERGSRQMNKKPLKYLRVLVEPGAESKKKERVNIRVPLNLVRAGLKWAAFIPKDAQIKMNEALHEKGIEMDFTKMTAEDLEVMIENLHDLTVEVEGEEKVRIFCE